MLSQTIIVVYYYGPSQKFEWIRISVLCDVKINEWIRVKDPYNSILEWLTF